MIDFIFANISLLAILLLVIILSSIISSRLNLKRKLMNALGLVLYELHFQQEEFKENEQQKNIKELISKMEQFLSGMSVLKEKHNLFSSKKPYFVLELALKDIGEEVVFYAAVPRSESRIFEKQIESFFPNSRVFVQENDYNVFNREGFSAVSYASLQDSPILPIRIYQDLDFDPIETVLNSFSKLRNKGEGAAFQLIVIPADSLFKKKLKMALSALREGESLEKVKRKIPSSFSKTLSVVSAINDTLFFSSESVKQKQKELGPIKINEEAVKILEKKANKEAMAVNFRLVSSASTQNEAELILKELESAFFQLSDPRANGFKFIHLKGRILKDALTNFSFRIFDKNQKIYLNTSEITTVFHFPVKRSEAPHLKILKSKLAPAPFDLPKTGSLLGVNSFRSKESEIRISLNDRRRHLYMIGQTGTGKSNLMEHMAVQDARSGAGFCVIDPHGGLVDSILSKIPDERIDDVIYFDPASIKRPMGLNMLEYDLAYPEQKTFIANEVYDIFRKLWEDIPEAFGPMFEQYYRNSILLVLEDPASGNTLLEVIRVLSDKNFRDFKLSRTSNPILKSFWRDVAEKAGGESALVNIVPYITSKYDTFLNNEIMRPILVQEKSSFNFRDIMDNGKILLVNLSKGRLGDLNAYLVGLIFVGKILMAALSRSDVEEDSRRDFFLYLDEFQNITTKSIATILSEARKYRLNLTIAHQFIGQLEENIKKAVFGNVGSMAIFRIGIEDAEFLERQFLPVFNKQDLINIDNFNAYVKLLINGQTVKPFNIKILPPEKGNFEKIGVLKELSALKYGRSREEVEEAIRNKYQRVSL